MNRRFSMRTARTEPVPEVVSVVRASTGTTDSLTVNVSPAWAAALPEAKATHAPASSATPSARVITVPFVLLRRRSAARRRQSQSGNGGASGYRISGSRAPQPDPLPDGEDLRSPAVMPQNFVAQPFRAAWRGGAAAVLFVKNEGFASGSPSQG